MESELKATPCLDRIQDNLVVDGIFLGPARGMGAPVEVERGLTEIEGFQDERGSTQVIGRADDFSGAPALLMHNLGRVIDVLKGVLGLGLFEDVGRGNSLADGELCHGMGLYEVVMRRASRHDDVRSDPGLVLSNSLKDSLALLRRRSSIHARWSAQDDDRVEVRCRSVVAGNG